MSKKAIHWCCFAAAALAGVIAMIPCRYCTNPDMYVYLELADAMLQGDWAHAINSAWPPLLSVLMIPAVALAQSPEMELIFVRVAHYLIYLLGFAAFYPFLDLLLVITRRKLAIRISPKAMIVAGWGVATVFGLTTRVFLPVTPDQVQVPLLLLVMVVLARGYYKGTSVRSAVLLGVILAVGYYAKSIFLPLGFVCAITLGLLSSSIKRGVGLASLSLAVMLLLIGPFVATISAKVGRPTIGDSGKINYGMFVTETVNRYASENLSPTGILWGSDDYPYNFEHQVNRVKWEHPDKVTMRLDDMVQRFVFDAKEFRYNIPGMLWPLGGLLFGCAALGAMKYWRTLLKNYRYLLLFVPSLALLGAYMIVLPLWRYAALPCMVMLLLLVPYVASLARAKVLRVAFFAFMAYVVWLYPKSVIVYYQNPRCVQQSAYFFEIAENYQQKCTFREVCLVRYDLKGMPSTREYWMRYANVRIRASYFPNFPDKINNYYDLTPSERGAIKSELKAHGVPAILHSGPPEEQVHPDWIPISHDRYVEALK